MAFKIIFSLVMVLVAAFNGANSYELFRKAQANSDYYRAAFLFLAAFIVNTFTIYLLVH